MKIQNWNWTTHLAPAYCVLSMCLPIFLTVFLKRLFHCKLNNFPMWSGSFDKQSVKFFSQNIFVWQYGVFCELYFVSCCSFIFHTDRCCFEGLLMQVKLFGCWRNPFFGWFLRVARVVRMYIGITIRRYRAIQDVGKFMMCVGIIAYYQLMQVCQVHTNI